MRRCFRPGNRSQCPVRSRGPGEGAGWDAALQNGSLTEEGLLVGLVTSSEYYDRVTGGGPDAIAAWVRSLYEDLLGRAAKHLTDHATDLDPC